MLNDFQKFIHQHNLFEPRQKLLVAVSGGADSVVLLHLLMLCRYNVSVAHCNFKLRGQESDADEEFVKQMANRYQVPFYSIKFDTLAYVHSKKISIEMAARELRYDWFNGLLRKYQIPLVVTGHHLNDSIETLLLNLCRGTGINGIKGISVLNGNIARPLMFATRERIESYARLNNLAFCTDTTNQSDNYLRNIIRQQVIPGLKKVNPDFEERMRLNFENINQAAEIYNEQIEQSRKKFIIKNADRIEIDRQQLEQHPFKKTLLHEFIRPFGFNSTQTDNIIQVIDQPSGKRFFTNTHQLLIDRQNIIIEPNQDNLFNALEIEFPQEIKNAWLHIKMRVLSKDQFELDKRPQVACLDYHKIHFPITIRPWQSGDQFYPLGMEHPKKISDYFVDAKTDRFKKEKSMVMTSRENIIWLMGHRIDNRVKITDSTQTVLVIEMIN